MIVRATRGKEFEYMYTDQISASLLIIFFYLNLDLFKQTRLFVQAIWNFIKLCWYSLVNVFCLLVGETFLFHGAPRTLHKYEEYICVKIEEVWKNRVVSKFQSITMPTFWCAYWVPQFQMLRLLALAHPGSPLVTIFIINNQQLIIIFSPKSLHTSMFKLRQEYYTVCLQFAINHLDRCNIEIRELL